MDGRIYYLREQIANNLSHHWTIKEMAEAVELSAPHFQKLFKTNVGSTPIIYLRELRLAKALERLENSFCQLKQIGIEIGMADDSHFTRDFKSKFGVTPTEYRKQYWEKIQTEASPVN